MQARPILKRVTYNNFPPLHSTQVQNIILLYPDKKMTANARAVILNQSSGSPDSERKLSIIPKNSPEKKQIEPLTRSGHSIYRDYSFEVGVGMVVLIGISLVAVGIHLINNRLRK